LANSFNSPCNVVADDLVFGIDSTRDQAKREWSSAEKVPISRIRRRRMNANQHFGVTLGWRWNFAEAEHVGGAISFPHHRFHGNGSVPHSSASNRRLILLAIGPSDQKPIK